MSAVNAGDFFKTVKKLRPALNVGCLMDIPTGRVYIGKHGESIINGGLSHITGVCGQGNAYKSTFADFLNLRVLDRYEQVNSLVYDSEFSKTYARFQQLSDKYPNIGGVELEEIGRLALTDGEMMGDEWWDQVRAYGKAKEGAGKKEMLTTPFLDKGKPIQVIRPTTGGIDSMSMMPFGALETIYDKNSVDSKEMNAEALRSNLIKNRILMQLPSVTSDSNIYMTVVAHMGEALQLDPYAPNQKKLSFMKQKLTFKQVPEKFTFLTNNLYYCYGARVFDNQSDKTPMFPRSSEDRRPGDTDLQRIQVQNLRAKSGPTGIPFEIVVSQTEGLLPSLTELHFLRSTKQVGTAKYPMGYGLDGSNIGYMLDLLPDVKLSRTTARSIIDNDPRVRRALEITSEMAQITMLWKDFDEKYKIPPAELYRKLKEDGYDWDMILSETRGYWLFEENTSPLKFLSTVDLLKMYHGEYKPYWLK